MIVLSFRPNWIETHQAHFAGQICPVHVAVMVRKGLIVHANHAKRIIIVFAIAISYFLQSFYTHTLIQNIILAVILFIIPTVSIAA
jgi:hypothetical protein